MKAVIGFWWDDPLRRRELMDGDIVGIYDRYENNALADILTEVGKPFDSKKCELKLYTQVTREQGTFL